MYDFETSLPAYQVAKENINDKQKIVFNTIKKLGVCSDHQIADFLGWAINRVTPRRGELYDTGKIIRAFRGKDFETGRTVSFWKINETTKVFNPNAGEQRVLVYG
jgi:hypothetical protein